MSRRNTQAEPTSEWKTVSEHSRLAAYPLNLASGQGHVAVLSSAFVKFAVSVPAAIDTGAKFGDVETGDLFTEVSRSVDKLLWMIEAHVLARN